MTCSTGASISLAMSVAWRAERPSPGVVVKPTGIVRLFANYAQGFKPPEPNQVNNGFANPVANIGTANVGSILSASAPRILQFALRLSF